MVQYTLMSKEEIMEHIKNDPRIKLSDNDEKLENDENIDK